MAEIRINATGGVKLYDADDSHYAQIVAGTITSNVDAITLGHNIATFNAAVTATGILKTDDTTEATSTTDGSLQTDGGLSVAKDTVLGDDLKLLSDSSVIAFGADGDTTLTHTDGTGLTLNSTNKLCFNDATQFIQGASGTVLDIAATDEIELTATLLDVNANLDVSGTSLLPTLGVITAKDLGAGIHIRTSDTGASVHANADEFVIEQEGAAGMTILSADDNLGTINFGDSGSNVDGGIVYDHDGQDMKFFTGNGGQVMNLTNNGQITTRAELAPDVDNGGICLSQGSDDNNLFSLKSSDVAHGLTDIAETDTYAQIRKSDGNLGGMKIDAFKENGVQAFQVRAIGAGTPDTTKGTAGNCLSEIRNFVNSGTDIDSTSTSNANLFGVFNGNGMDFCVDAEGDLHVDGSTTITAYDAYDDAQLVRALDLSKGRGVINSKFDKFVSYNHEHLAELKLVGREKDGTPNHFINVTGFQRLHNGAIWQQYEKHNQLLEAVYDLAKEAVGEEKANAILDKHEVKRLQ